jgi:chemotaxis protein methyltransferase CheR
MVLTELTEDEFSRFCELIYRTAGIRIPGSKRIMVSNRLRRRLKATKIDSFSTYYNYLVSSSGMAEMPLFLDEITTNETYFYRDPQHFEWIRQTFLPSLVSDVRGRKREKGLRVWSAACSTGEELYSIALKVVEKKELLSGWPMTLLGTDLSGAALASAKAGQFDERALRLVSQAERQLRFDHDPQTQHWTLKPEIRSLTTWKCHNLLRPLKESAFDCIFIKNVLIYFDAASKQTVVQNLIKSLAKNGYLVVGPTEGIYNMLGGLTKHKPWLYQKPD